MAVLDSLISLIVANLMRGRNVAPLITILNLKISLARGGCAFKTTTMDCEPEGPANNYLPFKEGRKVFLELLDLSLGGGGKLKESDLSEEILDILDLMGDARGIDKRRITNHPTLMSPQALMVLFQRVDSILSDEVHAFGLARDDALVDNLFENLPYLDESDCYCFHDAHPFFEYWLDFGKEEAKRRKNNPGRGDPWPRHICGRKLVKLHRHGGVHVFGPARVIYPPAVVLRPATSRTPAVTVRGSRLYRLADVQRLFGVKYSKYPSALLELFADKGLFEKLDMATICPEKAWFSDWSDYKATSSITF